MTMTQSVMISANPIRVGVISSPAAIEAATLARTTTASPTIANQLIHGRHLLRKTRRAHRRRRRAEERRWDRWASAVKQVADHREEGRTDSAERAKSTKGHDRITMSVARRGRHTGMRGHSARSPFLSGSAHPR